MGPERQNALATSGIQAEVSTTSLPL